MNTHTFLSTIPLAFLVLQLVYSFASLGWYYLQCGEFRNLFFYPQTKAHMRLLIIVPSLALMVFLFSTLAEKTLF